MGFIYKITNTVNNKIYIGLTINSIQVRRKQHKDAYLDYKRCIENGIKPKAKSKLYAAMIKYGEENFTIEPLEECDTIEELNQQEKFWIKYYDAQSDTVGYNISAGGGGHSCDPWNKGITKEQDSRLIPNQNSLDALENGRHLPASEKQKQTLANIRRNIVVSDSTKELLRKNQLGRKIINNGIENKYVFDDVIEDYLNQGWQLGQVKTSRKWVNDGTVQKSIPEEQLDAYLSNGWKFGMLKRH